MDRFDVVQIPYYLQVARTAMMVFVALLIAWQLHARKHCIFHRPAFAIPGQYFTAFDLFTWLVAVGLVGVSAGRNPILDRDHLQLTIRILLFIGAIAGIIGQSLLIASMTKRKNATAMETSDENGK